MTLKLNIGVKDGKTHKKELSDEESKSLMGKKIGDKVSGNSMGFPGYEFEITGGSDSAGFPMRVDVNGTGRKKILATKGVGFYAKKKGLRKRITVAGNTIYGGTVQVNLKTVKYGKASLGESESSDKQAEEAGNEEAEPEDKGSDSKE